MKDRLEELKAQRRLVQSHLTWLDEEIRREEILAGSRSSPTPAHPEPPATSATERDAFGTEEPSQETSGAPENLEIDHGAIRSEVRKGCFLYLAIAAGMTALAGLAVYMLYRT